MHIFLILGKILYLFSTYLEFHKNDPSKFVEITNTTLGYYCTLRSVMGDKNIQFWMFVLISLAF